MVIFQVLRHLLNFIKTQLILSLPGHSQQPQLHVDLQTLPFVFILSLMSIKYSKSLYILLLFVQLRV